MGWENVFHCEWNEFGKKILQYYWPNAKSYDDITKTDFTIWRGKIDILTGGFPCQPYSTAGKRLGKEDARHLWPEMLRAIREIKPKYIVGENVSGLLSWNGGLVFNEVQTDLEAEGYEVQPVLLPACAVNAPHRRDRIWFVAYSNECAKRPSGESGKTESNRSENNDEQEGRRTKAKQYIGSSDVFGIDSNTTNTGAESLRQERKNSIHGLEDATNSKRERQSKQRKPRGSVYSEKDSEGKASWAYDDGRWPTQSPICRRDDGVSRELDGITFPKWRQESIKAYGNAIVPQVAHEIFKVIDKLNYP